MDEDRQAIVDALHEIAWIFDHKQWERLGEVFTADAEGYGQQGLDAIVAQTVRYLSGCAATQHLVGNHRIQVDGDTATSTSYVRAFHRAAGTAALQRLAPGDFWDFLGEYHDTWRRTPVGWRLCRRICVPLAGVGELVLPTESRPRPGSPSSEVTP